MPDDTTLSYLTSSPRSSEQSRWGMASLAFCMIAILSAPIAIILGDAMPLWLMTSIAVTALSELAAFITGFVGIVQKRHSRAAALVGVSIASGFLLFLLLGLGVLWSRF